MKRTLLPFLLLYATQTFAQGGESCATAQTIPSIPYSNTGNTSTSVDNHFTSCADVSNGGGGKDRVYQYTTGATAVYVDVSLCVAVTNFDSQLYIYENTCSGTPYACREDGCQSPAFGDPYNSTLTNIILNPGTTYYFVVDGYNTGSSGNYRLDITLGAGPPVVLVPFLDSTSKLPTSVFHSGNAVGIADMNNDGLDDIVRPSENSTMYIEYQQADGSFTELSFPSQEIGDPWGMCIGDINNDGYNDVLYGDYSTTYILKSTAGTAFNSVDVSTATGAGWIFVQGANFFDINSDGKLDAFVCNDVDMPHVFMGDGSGDFTFDQSTIPLATVPASDNSGNYASIWSDINNDDYPDLFITHCRQGESDPTVATRIDQVFFNDGDYTYTQDVTNFSGLRSGAQGWSSDFADFDNDGDLDAMVLNYDVNSHLFNNNGSGVFTDVISTSGIGTTEDFFGMNVVCEDFNNDGYIDIFISGDNVHKMYINDGDFTFTLDNNGLPYGTYKVTSQALGDLNNDGKVDMYASYCNVYNNPSSTRQDKMFFNNVSNGNHYISFRLQGVVSNRAGIGAKIKIYGPWGVQTREVRAGEAYGINNSFIKHFGTGTSTGIDSAVIIWPSGIIDYLPYTNTDQVMHIIEGTHGAGIRENRLTEVKVFPNPTTGLVTIDVPQHGGNGSIIVRDLSGRTVYQTGAVQRYNVVDLTKFESGVYTYEVTTPKGKATGKLVKQ